VIPRSDSHIVEALKPRSLPFVVVGQSHHDPDVTMVDADNVALAYNAVRHLTQQGHRRIAALCGNSELASNAQRLEGYRSALAEAHIAYDEALVLPGVYWEWSGRDNTETLMSRPASQRPTALFCGNGRIALGAMQALESLGIAVPREISITAVSETAAISTARIPLTASQMPLRLIGERAVESLLDQIHTGKPAGEKICIPGELVIRESVACPFQR
jgi:LacI family transcriptional regulator